MRRPAMPFVVTGAPPPPQPRRRPSPRAFAAVCVAASFAVGWLASREASARWTSAATVRPPRLGALLSAGWLQGVPPPPPPPPPPLTLATSAPATVAVGDDSAAGAAAAARLAALLAAPLAHCPSAFVERVRRYAMWREGELARMRARDPGAARVLVYSCSETPNETTVVGDDCGGFADRVVGIVHLFVYALLHDLVFFVDWNVAGEQVAPQVFHGPLFNWTWDAGVAVYGDRTVEHERMFMGCPDHNGPCPLMHDEPAPVFFPSTVTLTRLNKGAVRYSGAAARAALWDELRLEEASAGGCLLRALVAPNADVVDAFRSTALALLDPRVAPLGMHVRTGDRTMHQRQERSDEYRVGDAYWQCALQQAAALAAGSGGGDASRRPVVFFACDDARYKADAVAHYGAAVVATDVRPWHVSKMQLFWDSFPHRGEAVPSPVSRLRDAFGEWWLLSLTEGIVSSGWSGYSRTAYAFSQRDHAMWVMDNYEGRGFHGCGTVGLAQAQVAQLGGGL